MRNILTYRKCELENLELLTDISRQTFIEAYEKDNNPDDFKFYINSAFNTSQMKIELDNPNSEFYCIYLGDVLVGYFKINQNAAQGDTYGGNSLQLSRMYLLKQFQGQNIGQDSLERIISIAKEKRKSWIWLSVWQLNVNAVRFYEQNGFKKFDTTSFYIGTDQQIDWLMRLDLV